MGASEHKGMKLSIHRRVDGETVSVVCRSGAITVLEDAEGTALPWYTLAFLKSPPIEQGRVELDGKPLEAAMFGRVGFGTRVSESTSIPEYLAAHGLAPAEVERFIEECELSKHLYLSCAQLPMNVARQVELLATLHANSAVVVLDDPFQPFNGRWREYFAEALLREVREEGRLVVVTNLSFLPQCWTNAPLVERIDVGKLSKPEVVTIKSPDKIAQAAAEASKIDVARLERQVAAGITIPVPENLKYAYREVRDHIFAPLARLSNRVRTYSAPIMLLGIALTIGLGAVIMVPNLGQLQASLAEMAKDFHVTEGLADLLRSSSSGTPEVAAVQHPVGVEETPPVAPPADSVAPLADTTSVVLPEDLPAEPSELELVAEPPTEDLQEIAIADPSEQFEDSIERDGPLAYVTITSQDLAQSAEYLPPEEANGGEGNAVASLAAPVESWDEFLALLGVLE